MPSQTNEQALEACIEAALVGFSREDLKDEVGSEAEIRSKLTSHYQSLKGHGYQLGWPSDFDREFAVDRDIFWHFLENTQPDELSKIKDEPNWQRLLLERLNKKILKDGIVKVLKTGLSINDAHFTLLYSQPFNDLNPEVAEQFKKNIFSVTRQVHYSEAEPLLSVDMVLFINGIAVSTIELKNPWTGQNVHHAMKQYQNDRDPNEPLFKFGRCLVHFAVDTDEVYMTTRLAGATTHFLPFNKGYNHGKGNPPNPGGHRTAYLWSEILSRQSLTNIIEHFAVLVKVKEPKSKKISKTLFFPRYHQLEVVRELLRDAGKYGAGKTYLIQHSAGSGKSNSLTWLAYQLIELYQSGSERPVFDSVVVVTDRRVLDKQLRDNIKLFSEMKNIVAHATSSQELRGSLEKGKKIIITTIQKFPNIADGIDDLSYKRFAVIIDEAHSSQSGTSADKLNKSLGDAEDEDEIQDSILEEMKRRKMRKNASYFAFTATPKNATLERFGVEKADGKFRPFHLYSMKQAIEEGFILDVLANYTTYQSYYEIEKSIEDNPLFDTVKAQKKLRAYVEGHKETIAVKADIMVNHFLEQVVRPKKLRGKAKGMVVTRNIENAINYFFAVRDALEKAHAPFKAMIAFSGSKKVDGIEYTEDIINGFPSKDIEDRFDGDDYRLLVVANKYLTGFDQPKLSTMYVDKKLQGVLAVQALSRLNRSAHALGKRKEDLFVLDFFNTTEEIKKAFDDFYTATSLSKATDVNVLHDTKEKMDEVGVYDWPEVEEFTSLYFSNADAEQLSPFIDTCVARFDAELELEEDEKADFKIKAKQFVKIYAQLASIIPYEVLAWEKLYWFLKFLIPKLKIEDKEKDAVDELLNSVDLASYGLERKKINVSIPLDATETEIEPQNPNVRGVHGDLELKDPLDLIVEAFNLRWFTGWEATPEEQRVKFINIVRHVVDNPEYQSRVLDNSDEQNRLIAVKSMIKEAVRKERKREMELYRLYASDEDFERAFDSTIWRLLQADVLKKWGDSNDTGPKKEL